MGEYAQAGSNLKLTVSITSPLVVVAVPASSKTLTEKSSFTIAGSVEKMTPFPSLLIEKTLLGVSNTNVPFEQVSAAALNGFGLIALLPVKTTTSD